jgi:hypothetical protein
VTHLASDNVRNKWNTASNFQLEVSSLLRYLPADISQIGGDIEPISRYTRMKIFHPSKMILQFAIAAFIVYLVFGAHWFKDRERTVPQQESVDGSTRRTTRTTVTPHNCSNAFDENSDLSVWEQETNLCIDSAPALNDSFSEVVNGTILSVSQEPLFSLPGTVALYFFERSDITIHYMAKIASDESCHHPVVRESYFLDKLKHLNVSPTPMGMSRGFSLCVPGIKCSFSSKVDYSTSVGYVIMSAHGSTLGQYFTDYCRDFEKKEYGVRDAILLGIELLELINTVHAQQIVHGSVSLHSFVSVDSGDTLKFQLINWRNAYRVAGHLRLHQRRTDNPFTPWEVHNLRPSYRDDVFRVFIVIAFLLRGQESFGRITRDELESGDIFCPTGSLRSPEKSCVKLQNVLKRFVFVSIDVRIDIPSLVEELKNYLRRENV